MSLSSALNLAVKRCNWGFAMSFQVGSQCFDSADSALQYMAASMNGAGVNSSGNPVSYYSVVSGSSIVTINSTGYQSVLTPSIPDCQLFTADDATAWSFAVVSILAIAFKVRAGSSVLNAERS